MIDLIQAPPVTKRPPQTLNILQWPHEDLSAVSAPVLTDIVTDVQLQRLMDDMVETMKASKGLGLAAIQVGVPLRVLVLQDPQTGAVTKVINPAVLELSEETAYEQEGCLSFLGVYTRVRRPVEAVVEFFDETGVKRTTINNDLLGRAIQHEIDHLNGVTFLDKVSALERSDILRQQKLIQRKIRAYVKASRPAHVDKRAEQKAKKAKRKGGR